MANYNFTDYESKRSQADKPKVGYFSSLKDDGDEAVVRLNYNTKADFKVVTIHRISDEGRWKDVECLKGMYDTDDKCPLCKSGDKMKSKIYVQMIQYNKDEQGKITAEPVIWSRGYGFVPELLEVIADAVEDEKIAPNTPIRDIVFKIKRVGAKGSLDTRYKLKVMQPAVVPEKVFVKDFSAFEGFDSSHHDYWVKSAEDLSYFVTNKKFPAAEKETKEEQPAVEEPTHPGVAEEVEVFKEAPATTTKAVEEPKEEKTPVNRYNW